MVATKEARFDRPGGRAGISADRRNTSERRMLAVVAALATAVLALTVVSQIYDSNLYVTGEATALLAGDHPYRDFFEVGVPLAAYLSASVQWLVGHRLIGEFVRQWVLIVAGVVISFHLGLTLSRSKAASFAVLPMTLAILAATPTYHYSKLFFFPLMIWVAWRYMDRPGPGRSAILGVVAALAFLYRHDYGIYTGWASVLALMLARAAVPASRRPSAVVNDCAAYVAAVVILLTPWAMAVQSNEGLLEYTRIRATLYQGTGNAPYSSLASLNPLRDLTPRPAPAPKPAVVGLVWQEGVSEALQRQLEQHHRLRRLDKRDGRGRWLYEVPNVYDTGLLDLDPYINDGDGFEWDRVRELRWRLPSRDNLALWLQQMALLVPVFLTLSAGWMIARSGFRSAAVAPDAWKMLLAAAFLAVIDVVLFRERSYVVVVAPVTAALSASFLAGKALLGRGLSIVTVLVTTFAAFVWAKDPLLRPSLNRLAESYGELLATPADDRNPYRYLHDCTAPGDRLLVTGQTPAFVSHYAQRPIAGGHVNWHIGWRSDPANEERSLALLQRQSVPIAISTHDPVLVDFQAYPKILEYLVKNYKELKGTEGKLLVDTRRQPTGTYGPMEYPCFR